MIELRGNGKRGRADDDIVPKVAIDPDLTCTICLDLVVDARQVSCCGSLFCKSCIESCLSRSVTENCPSCRASLDSRKIVVDKRSERKSADHPRNCPFHESYHCSFVGNRSTVLSHKNSCEYNPATCKNEHCQALQARELERQLSGLDESLAIKRKLVICAWQTPEEILRGTYALTKVKFFKVRKNKEEYALKFEWGESSYTCKVKCAHHNVSIMCSSDGYYSNNSLRGKFVLIHPADPLLNRSVEVIVPARREVEEGSDEEDGDYESDDDEGEDSNSSDGNSSDSSDSSDSDVEVVDVDAEDIEEDDDGSDEEEDADEAGDGNAAERAFGEANWMTQREFRQYAKDGKFALGVDASEYV